ncbi:hypothetical protein B4N89_23160 [Embleya scabrispora]|uniref:Low molecular weight antigen MTB12-like C-terminal domain-containing protein n=1 Tax=Embleya scabrispora TaxID=159449 RepID=A0A1T3P2Z2_9ACTN|nr:hypothetical protein [Embleya scabrispora]OPC83453.1 hypothetical protein B4N89_23160 [Embleya scabrispora]
MSVDLINERAKRNGTGAGRRKGARRALLALPLVAVLVMSGCSSDDDKDDKKDAKASQSASAPAAGGQTSAATPPATASSPATAGGSSGAPSTGGGSTTLTGEEKKVADNWDKLFDNAQPLDARKAVLENADKMGALVETLANDPLAKSVTSKTTAVKINGDTADVTFDILLAGTPALPGQNGKAVKQDGTWKVSLGTVCTLVGALKPGTVAPGCPTA